jgi:hypothetical protein
MFGTRNRNEPLQRRILSSVVLISFLFGYFPIPIPVFRGSADASLGEFPCQGGACGCGSAKSCWTSCCCMGPAARKAWAKRNGVTPPSYAILDESPSPPTTSQASHAPAASSCCTAKRPDTAADDCCATDQATCDIAASSRDHKSTSCCDAKRSSTKDASSKHAAVNQADTTDANALAFALSIQAMKCRGAASDFNWLPWFVWSIPKGTSVIDHGTDIIDRLVDQQADSLSMGPSPPPPRV